MKFYILLTALLTGFTTNVFGMESKVQAAAAEAKADRAAAAQAQPAQPISLQAAQDLKVQQERDAEIKRVKNEFDLGCKYHNGDGVSKNFKTAEAHYLAAANQKVNAAIRAWALNNLGQIYLNGDASLPKDVTKAIKHFNDALAAAKNIDPIAEARTFFNFGLCYSLNGPLQNLVFAKNYLNQALAALKALAPALKIQVQPLEAQVLQQLGVTYSRNKPLPDLANAQKCFEEALKVPGITAGTRQKAQQGLDRVYWDSAFFYYNQQDIRNTIHYLLLAEQSSNQQVRAAATKKLAEINAHYKQLCALQTAQQVATHAAARIDARHAASSQLGAGGAGAGSGSGSASNGSSSQPDASAESAASRAKRKEHPAENADDDEEDENEPGSTKEPSAKRPRKDGDKDASGGRNQKAS